MRLNSSDNKIIPKVWPFHNLTTCILTLTVKVKERPQLVTASFNKSVMYTKIRFTTSVSCSASKKNRLILDLSVLNKFIPKTRFNLDDWKSGISLSPVVGSISRLMTRHCQMTIAAAFDENIPVVLTDFCLSEV